MMYSKKSSVDYRAVMYSIFDHYTGKLRELLYKKIDSKIKMFSNMVASDDDDEEENEKDKKKKSKDSDDSDESDSSESEDDDESDEE